ncbi:hypothetical protein HY495_00925 [Candidatus Woesearchaeota archaeon]|nr:hypothetical protein [Candidatus Woesearchaeota archaeon]
MELSDRLADLGEKYVAPFLTGLGHLALYLTTARLKEELYLHPQSAHLEGALRRANRPYVCGELCADVAFPLLAIRGMDDFFRYDDPAFVSALGATLVLSNMASFLYEMINGE